MKIYELKQKKNTVLTVAGTTGNLTITIDGVDYTTAFITDEDATAAAWVAAHDSAIATAHDVTVTNPANADILMVSDDSGRVFTAVSTDSTGDMATTEVEAKSGCNIELYTSAIANGGNLSIMEMKDFGDITSANYTESLGNNVSEMVGHVEVLRREVKHESELVTYAADNDFNLVRKENDGSDPSTLRAEA